MGFPSNNANSVSRLVSRGTVSTLTGITEMLATGQYNLFSVPAVVDVSGMEFSVGASIDGSSGTPGLAAQTASSQTVAFHDGGGSGDNSTTQRLFDPTNLTSTTAWTAKVPRDQAGTSSTDLDADDWVNFLVSVNPTTIVGAAAFDVTVNYVYGKPGAIN